MSEFYRQLREIVADGATVALATIIRVAGSTPREVGGKMLIHPEGRHVGTVGGGCGEAEVMRAALDVLQDRCPVIIHVDLTGDVTLESNGVCGGVMEVLVEPWPPAGEEESDWAKLLDALAEDPPAGQSLGLLTSLPPGPARHALLDGEGRLIAGRAPAEIFAAAGKMLRNRQSSILPQVPHALPARRDTGLPAWFLEVQRAAPTLLIVGAGHIAVPLAKMAALLDFRVVVLDDRPSFVNRERFPDAAQLICQRFEPALKEFPIDPDTYIVIVTRGHQHDVASLLAVIDSPAAYIGMIGSRRRVAGVFRLLERELGLAPEKLRRVYSPIGLEIGAVTPAEIALAIMAEVINVYRHGRAPSSSDYRRLGRSPLPREEVGKVTERQQANTYTD